MSGADDEPDAPLSPHRCEDMEVVDYSLDEVVLPGAGDEPARTAVRIVILGRNLREGAIPLVARVGDVPVELLELDVATQTLEGVLLREPEAGSLVRVSYLDMGGSEHPLPYDPRRVTRID
jgi:hypothetical protein